MYNTEQIKELIKVLEDSSLSVLEIVEKDGSKIRLEKAQPAQQIVNTIPVANGVAAPAPIPTAPLSQLLRLLRLLLQIVQKQLTLLS